MSVNGTRLEGLSFPEAVELIKAAGEQGGPRVFIVRQHELPSAAGLQAGNGQEVSSEVSSPLADGQNAITESPVLATSPGTSATTSISTEATVSVGPSRVDTTAALPSASGVAYSGSPAVEETTTKVAPELPVPMNAGTRSESDATNSTVTHFHHLRCHCYNC